MNILEAEELKICIGKFALNIEKLTIKAGDLFEIKGSNGVGKTLLLNTILGFVNYQGKLSINISNVYGFINNDFLVPYLYPEEYFQFIYKLNSTPNYFENIQMLSEKLQFAPTEKKYIRNLSEGNKKKVGLISILALNNGLMIFDEPFAFLDDFSIKALAEIFINRNDKTTIIFTTHQGSATLGDHPVFNLS